MRAYYLSGDEYRWEYFSHQKSIVRGNKMIAAGSTPGGIGARSGEFRAQDGPLESGGENPLIVLVLIKGRNFD
ncbi:MAG TPA: hypothetical protein VIW80_20960 [Pyrinomonadaceae bacterium]